MVLNVLNSFSDISKVHLFIHDIIVHLYLNFLTWKKNGFFICYLYGSITFPNFLLLHLRTICTIIICDPNDIYYCSLYRLYININITVQICSLVCFERERKMVLKHFTGIIMINSTQHIHLSVCSLRYCFKFRLWTTWIYEVLKQYGFRAKHKWKKN